MSRQAPVTYASVDLELTGFDPQTEEIIEVGIALFWSDNGKVVQGQRFSSLVRPQHTHLRHRIAGLTGISAADLEQAPTWAEISTQVAELLADTVLVGHGVDLDLRFLRAAGIDSFAGVIDTLELSQVFLPTYHSYNLESLGNLFAVRHEAVHRAGGDAETTIGVLQGLMGAFCSLSTALQYEVCQLAEYDRKAWPALFRSVQLPPVIPEVRPPAPARSLLLHNGLPTTSQIIAVGLSKQVPSGTQLSGVIPAWSVAFWDREQAFHYALAYPEAEPYVGAFEYLSLTRLAELRQEYADLSVKERLALQKVLIWKEKFSIFGLLSEINWSIIGTEAKKNFTTGYAAKSLNGLIAADFRSLPDVAARRPLWVHSLEDLLEWLSQKSGFAVSWQSLVASLRHVYNPETGFGEAARAGEVEMLIAAVDTYFVSSLLLVRRSIYRASGALDPEGLGEYAWKRLRYGAESLAGRIEQSIIYANNTFLQKQVSLLKRYFSQEGQKQEVVWLEFSDKNISFHTKPLEYVEAHRQFVQSARPVVYQTALVEEKVLKYIRSRIGLGDVDVIKHLSEQGSSIPVMLDAGPKPHAALNALLRDGISTLVLFEDIEALREYYDVAYPTLVTDVPVLAVGIHGGAHKILRNFNHSSKSVVLSAVSALHGYVGECPEFDRLVYMSSQDGNGLPHPYNAAIAQEIGIDLEHLELMHAQIALVRALGAVSLRHIKAVHVIAVCSTPLVDDMKEFLSNHLSTV